MLVLAKGHMNSLHILDALVCILEVDFVPWLHLPVCWPTLHPGLDVGHCAHPAHQVGNLRVGCHHARFKEILGAEKKRWRSAHVKALPTIHSPPRSTSRFSSWLSIVG